MKKHLIPLLVMAVLSVGLLYGGAVEVGKAANAVVVEENILQGDRSMIDGLTVQIRLDERNIDRWSSDTWFLIDHTFGETDALSSSYHVEPFSLDYSGFDDEPEELSLHYDEQVGLESLDAVSYLDFDLDSDRMFARGIKNEQYVLVILRESTREPLGEFPIPIACKLRPGDGFVLLIQEEYITVLEEQNGKYREAFTFPYNGDMDDYSSDLVIGMDYKDGKLAITKRTKYETNNDYQVSIYTSDGLQFEAQYSTSVRRQDGWSLHFNEYVPVAAAKWEDTV